MHRHPRALSRAAFTLIELLVVIAIIGILMSLTAAAVVNVIRNREILQARHDISQMSAAAAAFNKQFGIFPPSKIFLANNRSLYLPGNQLHQDSLAILGKMFPFMGNNWAGVDWSGAAGRPGVTMPAQGVTLEGDQCLVFFLGGIQGGASGDGTVLGFSTSKTNPTQAGGTRIGPFFEFKAGPRLYTRVAGNPFFSYQDPWGTQPYAFFSSGLRANGYNPAPGDCQSLNTLPYWTGSGASLRYHNSGSYQIICAGEDKTFGPGGQWSSTSAENIAPAGRDDMTNFHDKAMGIP